MKLIISIIVLLFSISGCIEQKVDLTNQELNHSIYSTNDLMIQKMPSKIKIENIYKDEEQIDQEIVFHQDGYLFIKHQYLSHLEVRTHEFEFSTTKGSFIVTLNVINSTKPYIISKNKIVTDLNHEIEIYFELFDGVIKDLSGHDILSSDYNIYHNRIVIKKNAIERVLIHQSTTLVLAYTLQTPNNTVIGYIFISKEK